MKGTSRSVHSVWLGKGNRANTEHEDCTVTWDSGTQIQEEGEENRLCVQLLSFKDNSNTNKIKYFSFSVLKASKPMMEKRRRERINSSLETLRLLMLENTRNEVRDLFQLYLSFTVGKPRGVLYGVQSFGSFGRLVPATKQKSSSTTSFASSRELIWSIYSLYINNDIFPPVRKHKATPVSPSCF